MIKPTLPNPHVGLKTGRPTQIRWDTYAGRDQPRGMSWPERLLATGLVAAFCGVLLISAALAIGALYFGGQLVVDLLRRVGR